MQWYALPTNKIIPLLSPRCDLIESDAGGVIRHRDRESFLFLTETQYDILSLCDGKRTLDDIINFISQKYSIEKSIVERDIKKFFKRLVKNEAICFLPFPINILHEEKRDVSKLRELSPIPTRFSKLTALLLCLKDICPLACSYCFMALPAKPKVPDENVVIPFTEALRLIREFKELGGHFLCLAGGEITDYPKIDELIRYAFDLGFQKVLVSTKGVDITPDLADKLYKAGLRTIQISIDTIKPETYANLIKNRTVEQAIEGIYYLIRRGFAVHVRSTITKYNIEEIPDLWVTLRGLGVHATRGVVVTPTGRADIKILPSKAQIENLERDVKKKMKEYERERKFREGAHKSTLRFVWEVFYEKTGFPVACGGGIFTIAAFPDGTVTICDSARTLVKKYGHTFIFGNWKQSSLREIWGSERLRDFIKSKFLGLCGSCKIKYDCLGGCPVYKNIMFKKTEEVYDPRCTYAYPYLANGEKRHVGDIFLWEKVMS
jgi:radical SAM protein with 4Fe4S-binding SPASM domain